MNDNQKNLIQRTIGMLWTIASVRDNLFSAVAADFAEDLSIEFSEEGEQDVSN